MLCIGYADLHMDLRHLRYFVAVVDEGQFVRAAAELHVAQSAVSEQIRALERELGAELLVRDRRGVTPTPAGEVLLTHARRLLAGAEEAKADVARLVGLVTGRLRVGSGSPSGPVPLPATLAAFQRRHPQVEIALLDTTSEELMQWLEAGEIDVALVSHPPEALPDRLAGVLVTREPMVVLLPVRHRLAGARELGLPELDGEPLVTFPRGSGMRATIDDGFRAAGVARPVVTASTIDPLATLELVGQGLGFSLMPRSVAEQAGRDVAVVPLAAPGLARLFTLAWDRGRRALPALSAFLDLAADWLPPGALDDR